MKVVVRGRIEVRVCGSTWRWEGGGVLGQVGLVLGEVKVCGGEKERMC